MLLVGVWGSRQAKRCHDVKRPPREQHKQAIRAGRVAIAASHGKHVSAYEAKRWADLTRSESCSVGFHGTSPWRPPTQGPLRRYPVRRPCEIGVLFGRLLADIPDRRLYIINDCGAEAKAAF
jgi:hypothetical protein